MVGRAIACPTFDGRKSREVDTYEANAASTLVTGTMTGDLLGIHGNGEYHLRKVFGKLAVKSRTQLANRMRA